MTLRGVLRVIIYAVTLYSIVWTLPAYASEHCGVAEHAKQVPCQAYFVLQARTAAVKRHVEQVVQPYVERVEAHPWALKAAKAYGDTPVPALLTRAQVWAETEAKPRAIVARNHISRVAWDLTQRGHAASRVWARRGLDAGHDWSKRGHAAGRALAKRGCATTHLWLKTKALPFVQEQWSALRFHAVRLAKLVWARVEASQFYNDWVVAQYHKIVKGSKPRFSSGEDLGETSGQSTVGSETPEATPSAAEHASQEPAYATPPAVHHEAEPEEADSVAATPSETANVSTARAPTTREDVEQPPSEHSIPPDSQPSKVSQAASAPEEDVVEPGPVAEEPVESAELEESQPEPAEPAAPEPIDLEPVSEPAVPAQRSAKKGWLKRLSRTVDGAISSMEDDGQTLAQRSVNAAKPEIMGMLREINKFGDGAVKESEAMAEELESRSRRSRKITREEVYPGFEAASREMAEMALKVRVRAEELANEVLDGLVSVRKVTLDSLDDYFDVVLVEAAKQISDDDNDEMESWKEYSMLKQKMREYRKRVEEHEFNMDEVNVALRESQLAAVVLVQDFNKQLTEQRARCQIILQERDPQPDAEINADQANKHAAHDSGESHLDSDERDDEPRNAREQFDDSEPSAPRGAKPAAYVIDQVVELEDEPVELPFDSELEFENSDVIETHWETRQVYQTVAA